MAALIDLVRSGRIQPVHACCMRISVASPR